ncbi:MAG: hypothetical protein AAFR23_08320 [Pseudomonadota bacterium]
MFSLWLAAVAAVLAIAMTAGSAFAGSAKTTRIEPRPYAGAIVTIESGVRVFRPLPPTKHVIINPGHGARINLNETTVNKRTTINSRQHITIDDRRGSGYFRSSAGLFVGNRLGVRRFRGIRRFRGGPRRFRNRARSGH